MFTFSTSGVSVIFMIDYTTFLTFLNIAFCTSSDFIIKNISFFTISACCWGGFIFTVLDRSIVTLKSGIIISHPIYTFQTFWRIISIERTWYAIRERIATWALFMSINAKSITTFFTTSDAWIHSNLKTVINHTLLINSEVSISWTACTYFFIIFYCTIKTIFVNSATIMRASAASIKSPTTITLSTSYIILVLISVCTMWFM